MAYGNSLLLNAASSMSHLAARDRRMYTMAAVLHYLGGIDKTILFRCRRRRRRHRLPRFVRVHPVTRSSGMSSGMGGFFYHRRVRRRAQCCVSIASACTGDCAGFVGLLPTIGQPTAILSAESNVSDIPVTWMTRATLDVSVPGLSWPYLF